jgi:hypothetical protein
MARRTRHGLEHIVPPAPTSPPRARVPRAVRTLHPYSHRRTRTSTRMQRDRSTTTKQNTLYTFIASSTHVYATRAAPPHIPYGLGQATGRCCERERESRRARFDSSARRRIGRACCGIRLTGGRNSLHCLILHAQSAGGRGREAAMPMHNARGQKPRGVDSFLGNAAS